MTATQRGYDAPLHQMALVDGMIRGFYATRNRTEIGSDISTVFGEHGERYQEKQLAPISIPDKAFYVPNDRQARYDLASAGEQEHLLVSQRTDTIRYHKGM